MSADGELPGMWEEADLVGGWADAEQGAAMSARDELVDFATDLHDRYVAGGSDWIGEQVDGYLARFAHELAERIRTELPERVKQSIGAWATIRTVSTAQHAADLIDPDVQEGA